MKYFLTLFLVLIPVITLSGQKLAKNITEEETGFRMLTTKEETLTSGGQWAKQLHVFYTFYALEEQGVLTDFRMIFRFYRREPFTISKDDTVTLTLADGSVVTGWADETVRSQELGSTKNMRNVASSYFYFDNYKWVDEENPIVSIEVSSLRSGRLAVKPSQARRFTKVFRFMLSNLEPIL